MNRFLPFSHIYDATKKVMDQTKQTCSLERTHIKFMFHLDGQKGEDRQPTQSLQLHALEFF